MNNLLKKILVSIPRRTAFVSKGNKPINADCIIHSFKSEGVTMENDQKGNMEKDVETGVMTALKNFFTPKPDAPAAPVNEIDAALKARIEAQDLRLSAQEKAIDAMKSLTPQTGVQQDELGQAATAEKAHMDKFLSIYVKRGRSDLYDDYLQSVQANKAAMNVTTDGQGGYLVPDTLLNRIVMPVQRMSYLRRTERVTVQQSPYVKSFDLDGATMSGTAVLTSEAAAYDQAEPTTTQINFKPYKPTRISKVSQELLAGSIISIDALLGQDAAQAFSKFENTYFTTGTGTAQPQGITVGATVGVTAASATAITGDEIQDLVASVDEYYRANAAFMMSTTTMTYLKKLKIGTGRNDYLWDSDLSGKWSMTLFGYPVFINESMPSIATTTKPIVFGDFSYFWIIDFAGAGMFMQRLNELYAATGQIGFAWHKYVDSKVVLAEAIKTLQMA